MRLVALALALLLAACRHPAAPRPDPVGNEVAPPPPPDAAVPDVAAADAWDECYSANHCSIHECEDRRRELGEDVIDAGTSCDEQCVLDGVAAGQNEEAAEQDCFWECQCGE